MKASKQFVIPAKAGIRVFSGEKRVDSGLRRNDILRKIGLAFFAAGALAGCSSLLTSSEPPPAIYVLHPGLKDSTQPAFPPAVLEIAAPEVPAGFDVDKIALYWNQGRRLDYYAAAKWPAPLDKLLQGFISQSAAHALAGITVVTPGADVPARFRLAVKALELQPVYKGGPSGTPDLYAALHFTLIGLPDEKVIDDFTVAENAPAASGDLTAVIGGLEALLQKIMGQAIARLSPDLRPAETPATEEH